MLNGQYCGNCSFWKDTRKTQKGTVPYFGHCEKGRPFRRGKTFNRNKDGKTYTVRYNDFTIRTDGCKDWRLKDG